MNLIDFFLNLDQFIFSKISEYGNLIYIFLFLIIFFETGIVLTPFLPGDSLIFIAGAISATKALNIFLVFIIMCLAAILGDSVNYSIGKFIGKKLIKKGYVKKEYIIKTEKFYKKYGNISIVLGRFMPIVRTFVPFMAGIGKMNYSQFLKYNILGAIIWVSFFLIAGYFFGNIPFVKENLSIFIILIIIISVIPIIIEYLRNKKKL